MRLRTDRGSPALAARLRSLAPSPLFRRIVLALLLALASPGAAAATYRYASSSNRLYVENGGVATLSAIKAALPSAPLDEVGGGVWFLRANLVVTDGSELDLHGTAIGGDVDELRLKSDSGGFVFLSAEYGQVDIASTRIRSWNASVSGPDTDYSDGRAYLRVRSYLDSDGVTARESRMDIRRSELSYLGYNGAEAYGVVWKVIGSPGSNFSLYDKVNVYGDITNSHLHHNYYGMYSFGLEGGQWTGNEVDHNVGYGFDPHDDSDDLTIENNDVHDNGFHGIIASKRCDHVVIRNNKSHNNKEAGIMLHRSSNDGVIEGNQSYDNADAGIALFAVWRTTVRNNTLTGNKYGIRLSMGSADSVVDANEMGASSKYGIYFYRGSDTPEPNDDGRPKRNAFTNNDVHDAASDGIKMADGDANTFTGNSFTAVGGAMEFITSTAVRLDNNAIPPATTVKIKGSPSVASLVTFYHQPLIKVALPDADGKAQFRDADNAVFDPDEAVYTSLSATSSLLTLTQSNTGGSSTVRTRDLQAVPASGTVRVLPTTWNTGGDRSKAWKVRSSSSSTSVSFRVGDLAPGASYDVFRGSSRIATLTADGAGRVSFASAPGSTGTVTYSVKPH